MLPGISGSLIAGAFLESVVLPELLAAGGTNTAQLRALCRWWRRTERSLGPASGARAIVDLGAIPLAELLGYRIQQLEPHAGGFVGALRADAPSTVVLRTTTWNADADVAWRDTVRAGRTAGARWGLVYTGTTLRIVDAARTWSRRTVDFR